MDVPALDDGFLREARADFDWAVREGLIDGSWEAWLDFLQGYASIERLRRAVA